MISKSTTEPLLKMYFDFGYKFYLLWNILVRLGWSRQHSPLALPDARLTQVHSL